VRTADVLVIGLGAMGAASAYQLARRGLSVIGIDRFSPPHAEGSSGGETRITRQAIGEGERYVPLALRSHELWREIEAQTGEELLLACGALVLAPPGEVPDLHHKPAFLDRTVAAARRFGIPHEELDGAAVRERFPQFRLAADTRAYFEPGGGLVYPERCIRAQLALARRRGAVIRTGETVIGMEPSGSGMRVSTDQETYEAGQVVLAAGAWSPALAGGPLARLAVHRQVLFWYEPEDPSAYAPGRFPVFIWLHGSQAHHHFYGFPAVGPDGVKVATETYHDPLPRPDGLDRTVTPAEADGMRRDHVAGRLAGVTPVCRRSQACLYTVTPDADFVLDRAPGSDRLLLVSACSGHGFKHSAAIGEAVAELAADGRSRTDLSGFALSRLTVPAPA
jgi:sarcosine oxidase